MPRLLGPDPDLPPRLFTLADARASGLTERQVRYRVQSGRWTRVARDRYRAADSRPADVDAFLRTRLVHVDRAVAAASRNRGTIIGFASAVLVHVLPLASRVPEDVTLLVPPGHWTGSRDGIRFRQGRALTGVPATAGVLVTDVHRTWLDLARTAPLADALAMGDAALAQGRLDPGAVADLLLEWDGARGCRRARLALGLLDGLRETALESASFAYFVEHRLPLPSMQVVIRTPSGRFLGRVDFLWEQARLVGEADGRLKYEQGEALYAEKRREDEIRGLGYGFVRWGWSDLRTPDLANRLRRTLQ